MTVDKLHDAIGLLPGDLIAEADKKRNGRPKVIRWKRYAAMAACLALILYSGFLFQGKILPGFGGAAENLKEYAADAAPMEQAAMAEPAAAEAGTQASAYNGEMAVSGSSETAAEETLCALPTAPAEAERSETTLLEEDAAPTAGIGSRGVETPLKPSTACFSSGAVVTLIQSRNELNEYLESKDWIYDLAEMTEICEPYDAVWFEENDLLLIAERCVPVGSDCSATPVMEQDGIWYICISNTLPDPENAENTAWHLLLELEKGRIPDEDSVMLIYE